MVVHHGLRSTREALLDRLARELPGALSLLEDDNGGRALRREIALVSSRPMKHFLTFGAALALFSSVFAACTMDFDQFQPGGGGNGGSGGAGGSCAGECCVAADCPLRGGPVSSPRA
jgi:hypothetical protein